MKKQRHRKILLASIVLLCIAIVVIAGIILLKQYEYGVSEAYYHTLRGG